MASIIGQGAATTPAIEDLVSSEGRVDLLKSKPNQNGRSFVWAEKLFLVDKQGSAVCAVCGVVVGTTSGNTTNRVAHYNSPSVDDEVAHKKKFSEATTAKKAAETGGARQGTLDSFTQ